MAHKAGFVSIIGKPNVGKSTLINALIGERLAITNPKAQTTRHRIMGFLNGEDYQIVFSDTPGILDAKYGLQEKMMDKVLETFHDSDVVLFVVDNEQTKIDNEEIKTKLLRLEIPIILLVNKADLLKEEEVEDLRLKWAKELPKAEVKFISALHKVHIDKLVDKIKETLPESPAYFSKEDFTDKPERFFVSEIVRKHLLTLYMQEIPYSCEVMVEEFKEDERIIRIRAIIFVERDSQKGIIIGKGGSQIKKLGIESRKDLEVFFQKQIFLDLTVKVQKNWRNDDKLLKQFGYLQ